MRTIVDFETYYCKKDGISTAIQGTENYVKSTDAYCVSIVDDDVEFCGTIQQARDQFGDSFWSDPNREFWAANSNFDYGWAKKYWPSVEQAKPWQCILDVGVGHQYPRDLANLSRVALSVKVDKTIRDSMDGVRFEDLPEDRQQATIEYCLNDSIVEKQVLAALPPLTSIEAEIAAQTRLINRRGVHIDIDRVESDLTKLQEIRHRAFKAIPWHLTDKPLSYKAMGRWCELNGIEMPPSLDKRDEECTEMMSNEPRLKKVIEDLRAFRNSNTSIEKAASLKDRVTEDGRLPLDILYCGAPHTRRWSSQGFNVQNLAKEPTFLEKVMKIDPKSGKEVVDMEKSNYVWAREWLVPAPGKTFLILDFSQIEPRCLNWLIQNDVMLEAIRNGFAIYEAYALTSKGWKGAPGTLKKADLNFYTRCKTEVLGLGYGMGAKKYVDAAAKDGIILTLEESMATVKAFRASNPKIPAFWTFLDTMMKQAILTNDKMLQIEMPTGDYLRHFHLRQSMKIDEETGNRRPTYTSSKTRGVFDARGAVHNLWGGALTENVTQRMARDVFAEAKLRVEKAGFPVIFDAHDELILEVDKGSEKFLKDAQAQAEQILCVCPDWCAGLPLAVEGGFSDRYCK